ncbi:protein FAM204A [Pygocentrus nattereri]|uniref:Family with sequence similarity 204 member A n=1 Tax=Pygocentrus nattereri TaxID=42514 RepID=A0A3B4DXS3_PYGNA|nr:protein FAM204A [Pygocentrus nattereri]
MYSGLLPKGLSEADVSDGEEDEDGGLKPHSPGAEPQQRSPSPPASTLACQAKQQSAFVSCQSESGLQNEPSSDDCLPGVPLKLWQKFRDLQKEREVQTVNQPHRKKRRKRRHRDDGAQEQAGDSEEKSKRGEERAKHWEELTQYFGVNDRFQPPACSRPPLKSGLEKSMESAIAEGDYEKAEELSDRLATRELAVKIAQATDCRDFARTKQEEEASRDARKRRKQVAWGFEAKKRWETKSNMGYM